MTNERELFDKTALELTEDYAAKTVSPVDVTEAILARAEALNPVINAFYLIDRDRALEAARNSENRWMKGRPQGLLDGVPVSIKDSIAVADLPMMRGTESYRGRPIPKTDSPPAARLRESGAVIFAKTTMPDLGLLASGISSAHGVTRNPWNLAYNTSGSSSGAAAALSARIGPLSIGSDLGGSVRLPASFCGLSTIKPTQGVIPHLPPSATRTAGPLTRTVKETALMLSVLSGADPMDFGSFPPTGIQYHQHLDTDVRGWKVGILDSIGGEGVVDPVILESLNRAADLFQAKGAKVTRIPRVVDFDFMASLRLIFGARGLAEVSAMSPEERALLLPVVNETVSAAESLSAAEFIKAMDQIELAKKLVVAATYPFDIVIAPTSPVVNFAADQVGPVPSDWSSFVQFTALFNQTGQPATVTCAGFDPRGLPFGLQFIGQRFDDLKTLQAAAFYERARGFDIDWPEISTETV